MDFVQACGGGAGLPDLLEHKVLDKLLLQPSFGGVQF